jgi:hypothetical protein
VDSRLNLLGVVTGYVQKVSRTEVKTVGFCSNAPAAPFRVFRGQKNRKTNTNHTADFFAGKETVNKKACTGDIGACFWVG